MRGQHSSIDKGETDMTNTLLLASPLVNLATQQSRHGAPGSNFVASFKRSDSDLGEDSGFCVFVCVTHIIMFYVKD